MNYHDIRTDDMLNGDGLRVVLFVSGCDHHCKNCQNPQTWDTNSGIPFTEESMNELLEKLDKPYISGLTLSGGDPLNENNLDEVLKICKTVKEKFPNKTIWLYTGFTWEQLTKIFFIPNDFSHLTIDAPSYVTENFHSRVDIIKLCDVVVDGEYIDELSDVNYHWAGSKNQRIINVPQSLKQNKIVLYK